MHYKNNLLFCILLLAGLSNTALVAQDAQTETDSQNDESEVPEKVDVEPAAHDTQIEKRLNDILNSTGWFSEAEVEVNDGVVFLRGQTPEDDHKTWAGNLARKTQDVVAVVNQIEVMRPDIWNYEPAFTGLQDLWRNVMRSLPFWVFGFVVLLLFWGISIIAAKFTRSSLKRREVNTLLQDIGARAVAVIVFLLGIYIVFHIADLTRVALTVLGGTGLLGIVLGIAFRDITENFLASIFLSLQHPFRAGDFIEIADNAGVIQRLTIRATLLMTVDGNHMQIPNSIVYKSTILNYTSNPNQRNKFTIGIGYDDNISTAQEIGKKILAEHPAVLKEPEPWVLVDNMAVSTVNIQFYYWVDGNKHNMLKVKSSLLRQVKHAYQKEGISIPDEAREMVFPDGVPVHLYKDVEPTSATEKTKKGSRKVDESATESNQAEGDLQNNANELKNQAEHSRIPESGENLLKNSSRDK